MTRMTDRQAEELKKRFEAFHTVGACMDCDDHPNEKLDGYCSEAHRAEGYADIIVGVCEELLRYKALAKKKGWKEPRHDEATFGGTVPTDEAREGALQNQLAALGGELAALREEHETTASGEYKRCACDLCTIHRRLDDPNIEIQRLTEDNETLHDAYEELAQTFDEAADRGGNIKVRLTRAVGFFTKSVNEMSSVVAAAIDIARKDPAFKARYDDLVRESRARTLSTMKLNKQTKEMAQQIDELSKRIEEVHKVMAAKPGAPLEPGTLDALTAQLNELRQKVGLS